MTVGDLITASFKRINVIQANETPSAQDSADALQRLADLVESWQTERLTVPFIQRTTWTLTQTKGVLGNPYTVGSGGDVSVLRPALPDDFTIMYQNNNFTLPQELPLWALTDDAWANLPLKTMTAALPQYYYYQPTYASSLGSLYVWPAPTTTNLQGVLYAPLGVAAPTALSTTLVLPPGYFRFLRDNLAVEIASEWRDGLPVDPGLVRSAAEAKANIKRANIRPRLMSMDPALTYKGNRVYSIFSDT